MLKICYDRAYMLKIVYNIANVSAACIPKYKSRGVTENAFRG